MDRAVRDLVRQAIARLRLKLLDLTNRNRLLNFRFPETSRKFVRIVDEIPELLFSRLRDEGTTSRRLVFQPLPEPPEDGETSGDPRAVPQQLSLESRSAPRRRPGFSLVEWARANKIDPNFDLPLNPGTTHAPRYRDDYLQTLLLPDQLARTLSAIRDDAKLAEQELGVSTLYAAFGFLEWFESSDSKTPLFAPLLLLPVQIDRELKRGEYRYFISGGDGADPVINVTLRERLKRDFGLQLPELEEDDSLTDYLSRILRILRSFPKWRIRGYVVVGHFSFARLAMYEDLGATSWASDPLEEKPLVTALLAGSAEGGGDAHAAEFDVDRPEVEDLVPATIASADSSQLAAVIDALQGRSFALKGPPGTGKSQTITNLIAATLAAGKRVLFVAEKQAALEVVASRLRDAGLGPFIFELHSTKTQKKKVLDSLQERLRLRPSRKRDELPETMSALRKTRSEISEYVEALNTPVGSSGLTLHEALWIGSRAKTSLSGDEVKVCTELSRMQLGDLPKQARRDHELLLQRAAEALKGCLRGESAATGHPLAGIETLPFDDLGLESIRADFSRWQSAIAHLQSLADRSASLLGSALPNDVDGLARFHESCKAVPPASSVLVPALLSHLRHISSTVEPRFELERLRGIARDCEILATVTLSPGTALDRAADLRESALRLQAAAERLSISTATMGSIAGAATSVLTMLEQSKRPLAILNRILQMAHGEQPMARPTLPLLLRAIDYLPTVSQDVLRCRRDALFTSDASSKLEQLQKVASEIREEISDVRKTLALKLTESPEALSEAAQILRETHPIVGLLSGRYRKAQRLYRSLSGSKWPGRLAASVALDSGASAVRRFQLFQDSPTLHALAGDRAAGIDTPFSTLLECVRFWEHVRRTWPSVDAFAAPVQSVLLKVDSAVLEEAVMAVGGDAARELRNVDALLPTSSQKTVEKLLETMRTDVAVVEADAELLAQAGFRPNVIPKEILKAIDLAKSIALRLTELRRGPLGPAVPSDSLPRPNHVAAAEATLQFAERVMNSGLPPAVVTSLLSENVNAVLSALSRVSTLIGDAVSAYLAHEARLVSRVALKREIWLTSEKGVFRELAHISSRNKALLDVSIEELGDWARYLDARQSCASKGMEGWIGALESGSLRPAVIADAFRLALSLNLLAKVASRYSGLPRWSGDHIERLRRRLVELDDEYLRLSKGSVVNRLLDMPVPVGRSQGSPKQLTERSLIEHEIGKQRKHVPLRDLLMRASAAARALKPCFMMSPASVAQYLPPSGEPFDIAIIDEASQMRPEEALGVIARAKQVLVVGDPMQLPPTSFFDTVDDLQSTDDEDHELDTDTESILDMALSSLRPSRELRWHYRSRHHSLIAFSNRQFYEDRLIVFPSPVGSRSDLGVTWVHVPDGTYQARVNVAEVKAVTEVVARMIREDPDTSIGVVAVNQPQRELLSDEFDRLFASDEKLEAYRTRWSDTLEPFFIKNLENVQGDERDSIVISTVYGPSTPGGAVAQRFGPINSKLGHRRLNVLFTRAKERVVVVSALKPEDIKPTASSSRGLVAFQSYLNYARSGRLDAGVPTGGSEDSPFEEEVRATLAQHGFMVEPQVGVAGYFIDLAVRHPVLQSHFVLGIECDGASYHSAKSARDRDRLRQEILEKLGWKLHRIWSTDWFRARPKEVQRLLAAVNDAVSESESAVRGGVW